MFFKFFFGILFFLAIVSLFIGLYFLLTKDNNNKDKRIMYALVIRISLCAIAVAVLVIALLTGKLDMNRNPVTVDYLSNQTQEDQQ